MPILAEAFFAILILAHCVDKPSYIDIVLAEAKSQMASLVVAALQLNRFEHGHGLRVSADFTVSVAIAAWLTRQYILFEEIEIWNMR